MGALGPRRVIAADAGTTPPPPFRVVDNSYSLVNGLSSQPILLGDSGFSCYIPTANTYSSWKVSFHLRPRPFDGRWPIAGQTFL